jgi:hypothetical protein
MDYCKEAKVGVPIKGQKMVILVYIYMRLQAKNCHLDRKIFLEFYLVKRK